MQLLELPERVRPYAALGLELQTARLTGKEVLGTCPFCSKPEHFHVNSEDGRYSCKAAGCVAEGNTYTFLRAWYEQLAIDPGPGVWSKLVVDRGIPENVLRNAGLRFWRDSWYIPIQNKEQNIINFRRFKYGEKLQGIPGIDSFIWNIQAMYDPERMDEPVYIAAGEWDGIAVQELLRRDGADGVVVAPPGEGMFKDAWLPPFSNRDVVSLYDHDAAGRKGTMRLFRKLHDTVRTFRSVAWPSRTPDGFDMRDFYRFEGTYEALEAMIDNYDDPAADKSGTGLTPDILGKNGHDARNGQAALSAGGRIDFETEVLPVYESYLYMTPEMKWALRILYAVILSVQIEGDPLWIHIASVPGSGKTELLASTSASEEVWFESTLTPHSLVSGWQGKGGDDPSLIPKLNQKTLVLKDFTEILNMNKGGRDEILATLRGAFDGAVSKSFGNGLQRNYNVHFNLVTGVTQEIYANSTASMGERFLIYHPIKGVAFRADEQIRAALDNVSNDDGRRKALREVAAKFLDYRIAKEDIPTLSEEWTTRLVGLAQFVAMLRAQVPKSYGSDRLAYRAQYEMGTRIAKQLKKLLLGLSLLRWPAEITEDDYRITVRVAMDTCVGFNLEIVSELFKKDGQTAEQLSETAVIPISTVREILSDLELLGVVRHQAIQRDTAGRPQFEWWVTEEIERHWAKAKLGRRILAEDISDVAEKHTQTTRLIRIKREGSGAERQYDPNDG